MNHTSDFDLVQSPRRAPRTAVGTALAVRRAHCLLRCRGRRAGAVPAGGPARPDSRRVPRLGRLDTGRQQAGHPGADPASLRRTEETGPHRPRRHRSGQGTQRHFCVRGPQGPRRIRRLHQGTQTWHNGISDDRDHGGTRYGLQDRPRRHGDEGGSGPPHGVHRRSPRRMRRRQAQLRGAHRRHPHLRRIDLAHCRRRRGPDHRAPPGSAHRPRPAFHSVPPEEGFTAAGAVR